MHNLIFTSCNQSSIKYTTDSIITGFYFFKRKNIVINCKNYWRNRMEFEIDEDLWKIELIDKDILLEKYRTYINEESTFAFGVCIFPEHKIWINKDMCKKQQIRTLKHELTHVFIWYSALYNVPTYNEEMVCDLVANSNNFINFVVNRFEGEKNNE